MSFPDLAPTLHHEGLVIAEMSGPQLALAGIKAEVLLFGGSKSSAFLKRVLDSIEAVVPRTERVTLRGLNHASPWNSDLRGKPGPMGSNSANSSEPPIPHNGKVLLNGTVGYRYQNLPGRSPGQWRSSA
jgi:hypothetical protein